MYERFTNFQQRQSTSDEHTFKHKLYHFTIINQNFDNRQIQKRHEKPITLALFSSNSKPARRINPTRPTRTNPHTNFSYKLTHIPQTRTYTARISPPSPHTE